MTKGKEHQLHRRADPQTFHQRAEGQEPPGGHYPIPTASTDICEIGAGKPFSVSSLQVHLLANGKRYSLPIYPDLHALQVRRGAPWVKCQGAYTEAFISALKLFAQQKTSLVKDKGHTSRYENAPFVLAS